MFWHLDIRDDHIKRFCLERIETLFSRRGERKICAQTLHHGRHNELIGLAVFNIKNLKILLLFDSLQNIKKKPVKPAFCNISKGNLRFTPRPFAP